MEKKTQRFEFELNMVRRNRDGEPILKGGKLVIKNLRSNSAAKIAYDFYKNGGR